VLSGTLDASHDLSAICQCHCRRVALQMRGTRSMHNNQTSDLLGARRCASQRSAASYVAFGSFSDFRASSCEVRFTSMSRHVSVTPAPLYIRAQLPSPLLSSKSNDARWKTIAGASRLCEM
jgi:hypothetical protein